ncbi:MAG: helix-turn-helix transcriptional regulator [Candidatus Riflebacteria bacterium]|nr:helix-turn-helix transcriptional regulator [Candidatus Riflebacteria bacterium]
MGLPLHKLIGARVAAARKQLGLTAEQFARKLADVGYDVTTSTVRNVERGKYLSVDVGFVLATSKITGLGVLELMGMAPAKSGGPRREASQAPPQEGVEPLVTRFRALAPRMSTAELDSHLRYLETVADEAAGGQPRPVALQPESWARFDLTQALRAHPTIGAQQKIVLYSDGHSVIMRLADAEPPAAAEAKPRARSGRGR